jgi:hypothetical protein
MRTFFVNRIKPILLAFAEHRAVRQLVIDLMEKYAKSTETQIDDVLVVVIKEKLLKEPTA